MSEPELSFSLNIKDHRSPLILIFAFLRLAAKELQPLSFWIWVRGVVGFRERFLTTIRSVHVGIDRLKFYRMSAYRTFYECIGWIMINDEERGSREHGHAHIAWT